MAVAKRTGPDFLFLANANSTKFKDLEAKPEVQLSFRDGKTEDWISVTGEAVKLTNDDPRYAVFKLPYTNHSRFHFTWEKYLLTRNLQYQRDLLQTRLCLVR